MVSDEKIFADFLKNNILIDIKSIRSYTVYSEYDILIEYKDGTKIMYDLLNGQERGMILKDDFYEQYKEEFKFKLQQLMLRNNINQKTLAKEIGISQQTISNYINGLTIPNYFIMNKLSKFFKYPIDKCINVESRHKHALL